MRLGHTAAQAGTLRHLAAHSEQEGLGGDLLAEGVGRARVVASATGMIFLEETKQNWRWNWPPFTIVTIASALIQFSTEE